MWSSRKTKMWTFAWLRLVVYSSHGKYEKKKKRSKRRVWVMPVLRKRKILTYTCLLYSSFKLSNPWARQTAIGPHCAEGSLQLVKLATKEKSFDPYRPVTGLVRVARNTNKLHKCFIHVAELMPISCKTQSFCFVSVLSVWAGAGLSSMSYDHQRD
jgi:hypothetical protein